MLFNSIEFAIFYPLFFVLFWFVLQNKLHWQNLLIVVFSFVFYGWWDWRFLFLLVFTSLVDFFAAIQLDKTNDEKKRRWLMGLSLAANLGILGFFKYFNFFVDSFVDAFAGIGIVLDARRLNIVLPVGISFYTFQALSYTIDVYRRQLKATHNMVSYLAFISFFPQLVAGPIERATNLLPQMERARVFHAEKAIDGLKQMIWGLFKKIVIADSCAIFANDIFTNHASQNGFTLIMGTVFFAFQIYGDFSGYSDIAIGIAKMLGFDLMTNFRFPYFSRDIAEFWRRWHISLSTLFRDYLYFPLGGSRVSRTKAIRNIFVIFLVSGFWHGANWTFLVWGGIHAALYLPLFITDSNRKHIVHTGLGMSLHGLKDGVRILVTFAMVNLAWIFFRAETIGQALDFIGRIFTQPWGLEYFLKTNRVLLIALMSLAAIGQMIVLEYMCLKKNTLFPHFGWIAAALFIVEIALLGSYKNHFQFIYFQF